jgi:sugar lactone lactonase YvrE
MKTKHLSKNRTTIMHVVRRAGVLAIVLVLAGFLPASVKGNTLAVPVGPPGPAGGSTPGVPVGPPEPERENAPSVAVGPPGTVFRYNQTFGHTGVPYLADNDHLYAPVGIGMDTASNLWVVEGNGSRALKYSGDGAFLMSIGTAGLVYLADETHFAGPTDIALDSAGNLWVADANAHRVVKFDPSGNYILQLGVTWESGADEAHFDQPAGLALDSVDNLYVSDFNNHRVQVFDSSGVYSTTIGAYGDGDYGLKCPMRMTIDDADNLYVADNQNHRVQIFDASHIYVATLGQTGVPGSGNGQFESPRGVAVDADFIYVADGINSRVQIFDREAPYTYEDTLGSYGSGNYEFVRPSDVALDPDGNLYVADPANFRVQKYTSSLVYVRTFGVTGVPYLTDDYHYNQPNKVAVDANGNIGILEDEGRGYRFIKLDSSGVPLFTIGEAGVGGTDNEHLGDARGVAFDAAGNIYIGDCSNHRVQIFTGDGTYSGTLGSYGQGDYEFNCPTGVAFDNSGNFYVADSGNQRIQIFDSSLSYSATLGETGVSGDDNAHFNLPQAVAVDAEGHISVADTYNGRVQVFDSGLNWQMTLGVAHVCGYDFDHFCGPFGVAVDASRNIYVAEQWNPRVQVFNASGAYLTTIGGAWGDLSSQFRNLYGVAVDSDGNVYIPDMLNHRIQKFAPGVPDWQQVNINGFGERYAISVTALGGFNGQLYAGTCTSWESGKGAQVYRTSDGVTWSAASEPGFGVYTDTISAVLDLVVFDGQLYAGAGWGNIQGQLWRTADGTTWEPVTTDGFGNGSNDAVGALSEFGGLLYAGVSNPNGAGIWRSVSGDPGDWTQVAPDEPGTEGVHQVTGFAVYRGALYAAVESSKGEGTVQVWRSTNGSAWDTVVADGFGDPNNYSTGGFAQYGGYLYLGTQNDVSGAQLWRTADGTAWTKVVGDGFGEMANLKIEMLFVFAAQLYAGTKNSETGLEVWRSSDGLDWEQVNLAGFGDSNNWMTLWSNSTAKYNSRLHIGTWNFASGGEIWRYDLQVRSVYLPVVLRSFASATAGP